MRRRALLLLAGLFLPVFLLTVVGPGCGPSVEAISSDDEEDAGPDAKPDVKHDSGIFTEAGKDALDEYVDPGCPDVGPPIKDFQCDPYKQGNGDCSFGEGCYIFVDYPPPDEPCSKEKYGAYCIPAGPGGQGDTCGGAQDCGAGMCCVVTGSGTQCVQLCPLVGNDGCPSGLVCEPIDVEGFGGCL